MLEPVFFEIPIYRTSIQNYSFEMKKMREKYYDKFPGLKEGTYFDNYKQLIENNHFYSWYYNEVIGFLNLYIFGNQLRVDYWLISNKRIGKGIRKKKFIYYGKTLEVQIDNTKSNSQIFEFIQSVLEDLEKRKFKKRHFDLRALKVIGRFVDWKTLSNDLNSWSNPDFRNRYYEGTF